MNIDFLGLIKENKTALIGIIVVNIFISLLYALNATKTWTARAYLLPPEDRHVQALNIAAQEVVSSNYAFSVREVYPVFIRNIQSRKYQREFFFSNDISKYFPDTKPERAFEENFHHAIGLKLDAKISQRKTRAENFLTVSYVSTDPAVAAKILNQYIDMVMQRTSKELADTVNTIISNRKKSYEADLVSKTDLAEKITKDKIYRLQEALDIATKLGIRDRQVLSDNSTTINMNQNEITNQSKLYLYGTEALLAEINSLKERKIEAPFVLGLRDLEARIDALDKIRVNVSDIKPASIDQYAVEPSVRTSPKRKQIVFLGTVFGFFLAFIFLLAKSFIFRKV